MVNTMGWNERSDPDMRTANFCDVYREGVYCTWVNTILYVLQEISLFIGMHHKKPIYNIELKYLFISVNREKSLTSARACSAD